MEFNCKSARREMRTGLTGLWIIPATGGGANRTQAVLLRDRFFVTSTRACHPERGFCAKDRNANVLRQFFLGACRRKAPRSLTKWICLSGTSYFVIPSKAISPFSLCARCVLCG
jgi:hypothetical protein